MKAFKKQILDFIPVFLGVILALFFNNINERKSQNTKIEGLLEKIALGTDKNLAYLNIQMEKNQRLMDSLVFYQKEKSLSIGDIQSRAGGIRYIQFDLAAWNVLKSSELLVDVDYELVSLLYLLEENIDASETLTHNNGYDEESKEQYISQLSDYLLETEHRIILSRQIRDLLDKR